MELAKRWMMCVCMMAGALLAGCGSSDDEPGQKQLGSVEAANTVTVDGVSHAIVKMEHVDVSSVGPGTGEKHLSADLVMDDGGRFGIYVSEQTVGKRIDLFAKDEAYDLDYVGMFSARWSNTRQDGIKAGSFIEWKKDGEVYVIDFKVEEAAHSLEGHYKGVKDAG